jgi:hypothetical protein
MHIYFRQGKIFMSDVGSANYKVTHTLTLYHYSLQIEALFDLIKGLIKDMDGDQDDEVRADTLL